MPDDKADETDEKDRDVDGDAASKVEPERRRLLSKGHHLDHRRMRMTGSMAQKLEELRSRSSC